MKFVRPLLFLALLATPVFLLQAQNAELQNTVIDSEQFDMHSTGTETILVFTGKVVAVSTNQKVSCDRLEVVALNKSDPKATIGKLDSFKSFVATGNVHIVQGDREAACGKAEVLPGDDKVVLTGQPVVVDHTVNWTWTGDELEMLRGERQIRGKNARFTGPPMKDLGVDKLKAPPAPETPAPATPKQP
jgi:lipopolysaccharide export system protein LptA